MKFSAIWILFATVAVSVGCKSEEEPVVAEVQPTETEPASVDDLIDTLITDEDEADANADEESAATPVLPSDEEVIPQHFLDAPVRNVVMNHTNGKPHKRFQAKMLGPKSVIQHGRYEEYFASGQRLKAGTYEYGKKIGEWRFWNKAGTLRKQGAYDKDKQVGEWKKFRDDGSLEWIEKYQDGLAHGMWEGYHKDGKTVLWRRGYKTSQRDGPWENFFEDGTPQALETYREGKLHGDSKSWNAAGKLLGEGSYQDGKRHGRFRVFDEDGNKLEEETVWEAGRRKRG